MTHGCIPSRIQWFRVHCNKSSAVVSVAWENNDMVNYWAFGEI